MAQKTTTFFQHHRMPVFDHLSSATRHALSSYLDAKNPAFRSRKLLEFFKSVDWLSPVEIQNTNQRLLNSLPPTDRRRLLSEIGSYHRTKEQQRHQNRNRQRDYKARVFSHFRNTVPAEDKILLESLRDYELDRTGNDRNWRHYFTMDSLKKIDAFVAQNAAERRRIVDAFYKDVDTYCKNAQRRRVWGIPEEETVFTFDDWCDWFGDEVVVPRAMAATRTQSAYDVLELSPGCGKSALRQQFKKLTLRHHPDMPGGNTEKMKAILEAYALLKQTVG